VLAAGQGEDPAQDAECRFTARAGESKGAYAASAREALARAYALHGNVEAALALLPDLLREPYYSFIYSAPLTPALLRQDPVWAALRPDPRFKALSAAS
jgi:hypothetical protein